MKLELALISALILMDYTAAAPWKHFSPYAPSKASLELGHEQVQEVEGYLEAGQKQKIQNNLDNDYGLQQQSKRREIYYPAAVMSEKQPTSFSLNVDPMTTGAVEAVFRSPTKYDNVMRLYNDRNNIPLDVGINFSSQRMTLNTHAGGSDGWLGAVEVEGFPFPCCEYVTIFTLRVFIAPKAFVVSVNGLELANYPFREGVDPPIERITYSMGISGAELISLMVEY